MFVKKDLRKIPKILDDAVECPAGSNNNNYGNGNGNDNGNNEHRNKRSRVQEPLSELRLGRRKQEFQGKVKILCQPRYLSKLQNLQTLNMYDCAISNLDDMNNFLGQCPCIETINLGRNPLGMLQTDEFSQIVSLKRLWLDDCQITGMIPKSLFELPNLEELRMPNNHITEFPDPTTISTFSSSSTMMMISSKMKILCLDRNRITSIPSTFLNHLEDLEELYVRHNELTELTSMPSNLRILQVSSNQLTDLNILVNEMQQFIPGLETIIANGNQITHLPPNLFSKLKKLKRFVISHNPLESVPADFWHLQDSQSSTSPSSSSSSNCEIVWRPNELLSPPSSSGDEDTEMTPAME